MFYCDKRVYSSGRSNNYTHIYIYLITAPKYIKQNFTENESRKFNNSSLKFSYCIINNGERNQAEEQQGNETRAYHKASRPNTPIKCHR